MSLHEFDQEGPVSEDAIRTGWRASNVPGHLARTAVRVAIDSLWNFYNRPLPDGARWALVQSPDALQKFASALATADGLFLACYELKDHRQLTEHERNALDSLIQIGEALGLKAPNSACDTRRFAGLGSSQDPEDDVGTGHHVNKRLAARHEEQVFTDVRNGSGYHRARLRNLSKGGVMIEGPLPQDVASHISINVSGKWIEGRVAWSVGTRCGIEFCRPLD